MVMQKKNGLVKLPRPLILLGNSGRSCLTLLFPVPLALIPPRLPSLFFPSLPCSFIPGPETAFQRNDARTKNEGPDEKVLSLAN